MRRNSGITMIFILALLLTSGMALIFVQWAEGGKPPKHSPIYYGYCKLEGEPYSIRSDGGSVGYEEYQYADQNIGGTDVVRMRIDEDLVSFYAYVGSAGSGRWVNLDFDLYEAANTPPAEGAGKAVFKILNEAVCPPKDRAHLRLGYWIGTSVVDYIILEFDDIDQAAVDDFELYDINESYLARDGYVQYYLHYGDYDTSPWHKPTSHIPDRIGTSDAWVSGPSAKMDPNDVVTLYVMRVGGKGSRGSSYERGRLALATYTVPDIPTFKLTVESSGQLEGKGQQAAPSQRHNTISTVWGNIKAE